MIALSMSAIYLTSHAVTHHGPVRQALATSGWPRKQHKTPALPSSLNVHKPPPLRLTVAILLGKSFTLWDCTSPCRDVGKVYVSADTL